MTIKFEPTKYFKYVFDYKFSLEILEFCRWLKKEEGYQNFGFFEKKWRFNDVNIIDKIKGRYPEVEIDSSADIALKEFELDSKKKALIAQKADILKRKTTSDIVIKGLKKELYPFQKVGVEFFINNNGRAILADTMGLGKTVQTLAYILHQRLSKTLVICPASVKYVWESEIKKWTRLKALIIDSKTNLFLDTFNEFDIFVLNYDIVKKFFNFLNSVRFDCLICDEFHYIKSNKAQRTKIVKLIALRMPSVLLLSGTPLLSRPVELFNGLQIMDRSTWDSWFKFTVKYCQGHTGPWGWDCRGASNIDELQKRISRYFLRRTKDEVLPELPPKRFIDIPVELSSKSKHDYDLAEKDFIEYLSDVKDKTDKEIKKSLRAEKLVKLGELRQLTSMGKVDAAEEIITNIIDGGEKVVVCSAYNEPLKILQKKFFANSVMIIGSTSQEDRKLAIEKFQDNPDIKIFFGGIRSAGVGITLTVASNVVFVDFAWNPADHDQAVDRTHRPGQEASLITIYQLYARQTIDDSIRQLLGEKKEIFKQLIENYETTRV